MNATMKKFGDPGTRLREFEKWALLLRPEQVTLGALVLVCLEQATAFSMLSREAFTELREITGQIERGLARAFAYDKINYLMLMMVDLDVHFHVLPRYARSRSFAGREFHDHGWPGTPELRRVNMTDAEVNRAILTHLKALWE
ncbi:MAG: HIT family protein [Candidatus Methylomirabilales bacterium]